MEEVMCMLQVEEAVAAAASSSTRGPKVIDDTSTAIVIACTPVLHPSEVSYANDSFPKHYA
jgi:hypothetical protein